MKFNTMLFDLDGTLVDTALDLEFALNQTLIQNNRPTKDFKEIRKLVSKGGLALIKFGFNIDEDDKNFTKYHQQLLSIYQQNIANHSKLFDGMSEVLSSLKQWGIITNKSENLTHQLLNELKLSPNVVVCGDTLKYKKPNPWPIRYAMDKLAVKNCLFVGDDIVDIQAGKNAGIPTIAVGYGYSQPQKNWCYDFLINKPLELKQWIL